MGMRSSLGMIVALSIVLAAVGCGGRERPGGRPAGTADRPSAASPAAGDRENTVDTARTVHVGPGQEPVVAGKSPFETALLRAKWQMERAQTAISREETEIIRDAVTGAQAAMADARKAAPRRKRRDLDRIGREIERLGSLADTPADPAARKAAVSAHKGIIKLLAE